MSLFSGEKAGRNPWNATTVEWASPSPPLPHVNFDSDIVVHHSSYEYSVPDAKKDFLLQTEK